MQLTQTNTRTTKICHTTINKEPQLKKTTVATKTEQQVKKYARKQNSKTVNKTKCINNYLWSRTRDFGSSLRPVLRGLNTQHYTGRNSANKLKT